MPDSPFPGLLPVPAFIIYSHNSDDHALRVLTLTNRLRPRPV